MPWSLHPAGEFAHFASEWDRLAVAAADVPFLQSQFIGPLLDEFARGNELVAVWEEGHGVSAMAIVAPKAKGVWETFQPSQLPLGPWLMRPGEDLEMLAKCLLRTLPGFTLKLGLTQLDPMMFDRPVGRGCVTTLDYVATAWVPLDRTFDEYWETRGKNLRANMRKQRKQLAKDGIHPRLEVLTRAEDVAAALESYGAMEGIGWKAAGGTAIHPDNQQGRFYRRMLENYGAIGAARIYRYWFGERVVAMDLCIQSGSMLVVLKTTYDETIRSLSPASMLREEELRLIFGESRVRRVEFFGKIMDWHSHWTKESRGLYHVNCSRWAWIERAQAFWSRPRNSMPESLPAGNAEGQPHAAVSPSSLE